MTRYPEKKVKKHIEKRIESIEKYSKKLVKSSNYLTTYSFDEDIEFNLEAIKGIKLTNIKFSKPKIDYSRYTTEKVYDLEFKIAHNAIEYTFEVSNYYFSKNKNEIIIEDILQNINHLINEFDFLLEREDFIFGDEDDSDNEDEEMTIDDVADLCGFYIDDDNHWIPKEDDYSFLDYDDEYWFKENLKFENGNWIYDDVDENGRFYWKE